MNLTEVLFHAGKVLHEQQEFSRDVLAMPGGSYPVTRKTPMDITVSNEGNNVLDIRCSGMIETEVPCDRCLTGVPVQIAIDYEERVDMSDPDHPAAASPEGEGQSDRFDALETIDYIHGYQLDVDSLVWSEVLISWPSRILCREDCKGLCRICGGNLNRKTCGCDTAQTDPRMAKIRDIFLLASRQE